MGRGGAKRIVRFWGPRGKTYHRARPPKPVLEASESGILSGLCRFPQKKKKENNRAKTNGRGGGGRIMGGGGSKTVSGKGVLWYVFPSPEFSTPLCFSLRKSEVSKRGWRADGVWREEILPMPGIQTSFCALCPMPPLGTREHHSSQFPDLPLPHGLAPSETMV